MQNSKIILPELPEKLKGLSKEEERIQKESVLFLKSNAGLDKRLTAYENAMDVVYSLLKDYKNESDDELTFQYIGIRLFNSLAITLRLMLTGYYQISFSIQRDIIEMAFLLDYFHHFPSHHIIPKSEGGKDTLENSIALCDFCHGVVYPQRWREYFGNIGTPENMEWIKKEFNEYIESDIEKREGTKRLIWDQFGINPSKAAG